MRRKRTGDRIHQIRYFNKLLGDRKQMMKYFWLQQLGWEERRRWGDEVILAQGCSKHPTIYRSDSHTQKRLI